MKKSSCPQIMTAGAFLCALLATAPLHASLLIHESGNYQLGTISPDPDGSTEGGLDAAGNPLVVAFTGNGLPATNVGGNPTGTSTGLRNTYNNTIQVVEGLTYSNEGGSLVSTHNAILRTSGTGFSTMSVFPYRFMATDPFQSYRSTATGNFFGWNGTHATELYYSVALNWNAIDTGTDNRLVVELGRDNSSFNTYLSQNGTNWGFGDQLGNSYTFGPATAGETVLVVCRVRFVSATTMTTDYWFNPILGQPLGEPVHSRTYDTMSVSGGQFRTINIRDGANILTMDEFRLGTTASSVMPVVGAIAPAAPTGLAAVANAFNEVGLSWTDASSDELQFIVERSLNGTTGWRQVGDLSPDTTTFADTGLNALTTYHYRLRAANGGGESAYTDVVSVTTPASVIVTPPPTDFAGVANTFSEITLTWTDNTSDETAFVIQRSPDGTTEWTTLATLGANITSYQNISLTALTTYYYRVYAVAPGGDSAPSGVAAVTTPNLPELVSLPVISQPFDDDDGLDAFLLNAIPGFTGYLGQGSVRTTSALIYPGLTTSGNGYQAPSGNRFYMSIDTTLPGFARYVSGGQIGGSGIGVLYVRWLAKGVSAQEANNIEFRTAANDTGSNVRAMVGTTFGNGFIRAMASSTATSGINTYVNTALAPSADTDLYVARFTFSTTGVTTMDLFVNQTTEGTPNATVSGAIRFNTIAVAKFGGAPVPSYDEFRIATSWAEALDVTSTSLQSWLASFNLPTDGTGDGALDADPDGDGVKNLLEYAFDADPTASDGGNLPTTGIQDIGGTNYLTLTFLRLTDPAAGITYTPQSSGDLTDWSGIPVLVGAPTDNADGTETVVYRDSLPIEVSNPRRFLRVNVTAP